MALLAALTAARSVHVVGHAPRPSPVVLTVKVAAAAGHAASRTTRRARGTAERRRIRRADGSRGRWRVTTVGSLGQRRERAMYVLPLRSVTLRLRTLSRTCT